MSRRTVLALGAVALGVVVLATGIRTAERTARTGTDEALHRLEAVVRARLRATADGDASSFPALILLADPHCDACHRVASLLRDETRPADHGVTLRILSRDDPANRAIFEVPVLVPTLLAFDRDGALSRVLRGERSQHQLEEALREVALTAP